MGRDARCRQASDSVPSAGRGYCSADRAVQKRVRLGRPLSCGARCLDLEEYADATGMQIAMLSEWSASPSPRYTAQFRQLATPTQRRPITGQSNGRATTGSPPMKLRFNDFASLNLAGW